ncbi:GTP pyrophosphokinase [Gammaproteobacteria bacterium]
MVAVTSSPNPVTNYTAWLDNLVQERPGVDFGLLRRACIWAEQLYGTVRRPSGETYLEHALEVAHILSGLRLDVQTLAAAVLHDVPEVVNKEVNLAAEFGTGIARLVEGVQRIDIVMRRRSCQSRPEDHEGLRKLLLSIDEDMRVLLIKLAERTHDLRSAKKSPEPERRRIATEAMDLYAPLANRLGMGRLKWELEDLSFRYLEPAIYQRIAALLDERRLDRENYLQQVMAILRERLAAIDIHAEVSGRAKHIYSIWRKMRKKAVDFDRIYDVRAVRILVNSLSDCYTSLGVIHGLWMPISGEFDDYIAKPKNNFYQSLHTAVVGPDDKIVEVQIRSYDMHRHAELGVAAHWRYKEGGRSDADYDHRLQWLRQFLALDETADPGEFMERFRQTLQHEEIHVFTPKGQVIDLPRGATPLDFAYHVHSEVGHRCRGAKVDGHIVPLSYQLRNGEQIEILTAKRGEPSRDWLNPTTGYLHTNRAREKVRHWFRQEHHEDDVEQGRILLDRELVRLGLSKTDLEVLAKRLRYNRPEDLMAALGRGDVAQSQISNALEHLLAQRRKAAATPLPSERPRPVKNSEAPTRIRVQGVGNLVTHFAQCCRPNPGDPIVGQVTQNNGISIHRADCTNVLGRTAETRAKLLDASWTANTADTWPVQIQIVANDRPGLLRDVSGLMADDGINILAVDTQTNKKKQVADMRLTVEVYHIDQVSRLLARINELRGVISLRRISGQETTRPMERA